MKIFSTIAFIALFSSGALANDGIIYKKKHIVEYVKKTENCHIFGSFTKCGGLYVFVHDEDGIPMPWFNLKSNSNGFKRTLDEVKARCIVKEPDAN